MKKEIFVTRETTESKISVELFHGPRWEDYRSKINTPIPFLNHMIEHIVWRSGVNIAVDITLDKFDLAHVVAEDIGMTIGRAVAEFVQENTPLGYGDAIGIIDEAKATAAISFEGRSLLDFTSVVQIPETVEGILSEDIKTFLEGFVQGASCTLHIDIEKGENAHHIWEAAYRALGCALGRALCGEGKTAGVAGQIKYEVEKQ